MSLIIISSPLSFRLRPPVASSCRPGIAVTVQFLPSYGAVVVQQPPQMPPAAASLPSYSPATVWCRPVYPHVRRSDRPVTARFLPRYRPRPPFDSTLPLERQTPECLRPTNTFESTRECQLPSICRRPPAAPRPPSGSNLPLNCPQLPSSCPKSAAASLQCVAPSHGRLQRTGPSGPSTASSHCRPRHSQTSAIIPERAFARASCGQAAPNCPQPANA